VIGLEPLSRVPVQKLDLLATLAVLPIRILPRKSKPGIAHRAAPDVPLAALLGALERAAEFLVLKDNLAPSTALFPIEAAQQSLLFEETALVIAVGGGFVRFTESTLGDLGIEGGIIKADLTLPLVHDPRKARRMLPAELLYLPVLQLLVLGGLAKDHGEPFLASKSQTFSLRPLP
jgi:hypothetical protein